jgi:hypothetical protein
MVAVPVQFSGAGPVFSTTGGGWRVAGGLVAGAGVADGTGAALGVATGSAGPGVGLGSASGMPPVRGSGEAHPATTRTSRTVNAWRRRNSDLPRVGYLPRP